MAEGNPLPSVTLVLLIVLDKSPLLIRLTLYNYSHHRSCLKGVFSLAHLNGQEVATGDSVDDLVSFHGRHTVAPTSKAVPYHGEIY